MSGHTHIHTHTYTHDNYMYYNPRCAHAHRGLKKRVLVGGVSRAQHYPTTEQQPNGQKGDPIGVHLQCILHI